ncbi:MAG: 16S rRNA (cytosine(1402)-N(4))-methyltransferase RsmH [Bacteroides sp.]
MNQNNNTYHIPVLLQESIQGLSIKPEGTYVDVTFGGGGHSKAILKNLHREGHLYSFDQDKDAEANILNDERFTFVRSNFRYIKNFLHYHGVQQIDGLLADLGVSSHHFDESERGFSFRFNGALDMRMNTNASKTAASVVNTYTQEALADVFYLYGELRNSRQIAHKVIQAREKQPIQTIESFIDVVSPLFKPHKLKKELARVFQALRIEVNEEMEALREMLLAAVELIKPGGKLVIITYHSLEDRMVKNLFRTGNVEGRLEKDFYGKVITPIKPINSKVITPSAEELESNPRSRSAKLRIAEKLIQ